MGQVIWTAEAERWLSEIHDFIARDNSAAAQRTIRGIYDKGLSLADFPERGYRHTSRSGKPLRILLYGHYRIAYSVGGDGDVVILGIFHGALDPRPPPFRKPPLVALRGGLGGQCLPLGLPCRQP